jgi:transposase
VGRCPAAELFGTKGRAWLAARPPPDEHQAVQALGGQLDFHGQDLGIADAELGRAAWSASRSAGC